MSDNKSGGLLSGLLIGTALGAVAGILATPRTGKETRHVLKKSADALPELAEDLATSVQFQADRLSTTALGNWEGTLERLREAISAGQMASSREWKRQTAGQSQDMQYQDTQYSEGAYPEGAFSTIPTEVATADYASGQTIDRSATTQTAASAIESRQLDPDN